MIAAHGTTKRLPPIVVERAWQHRPPTTLVIAAAWSLGIWFGLPELDAHARIAFVTFGLAIIGWVGTNINDTYIALAAALVFSVSGIDEPQEFFETLGDSTIWLLLAAFIIAAAVKASGLGQRLTLAVAARAATVTQLFYLLTGVLLLTAFVIPATSGRAALMVPIFAALSMALNNQRLTKALALLFPTIILLSAVASLIGAGAHLVTAEIVWRMSGEQIGFGRWLVLGLPFALISCFASTWVILHLFLNRTERRQPLRLTAQQLAVDGQAPSTHLAPKERYILAVVIGLVVLWSTEALHGLDNTLVALIGALLVTLPGRGAVSFKDGMKGVEWNMILFMAATLELGEALIESGGAAWLIQKLFALLGTGSSTLLVVGGVALVSLLAHLLINSRTARSSVIVPLVVLLGVSLGYNPLTLAFVSTAAAGFCLTLPVCAKPVAMFSQLKDPTYQPRDLLRLSAVLLPLHWVLLVVFAFWVWPVLGLPIRNTVPQTPPPAPQWQEGTRTVPDHAVQDAASTVVAPKVGALPAAPRLLLNEGQR